MWQTMYAMPGRVQRDNRFELNVFSYHIEAWYNLEYANEYLDNNFSKKDISMVPHVAHPLAVDLLKQIDNLWPFDNDIMLPTADVLQRKYKAQEEQQLMKELETCKKTAVFLPEVVAVRYKKYFVQEVKADWI